jgi:hypothetical protein
MFETIPAVGDQSMHQTQVEEAAATIPAVPIVAVVPTKDTVTAQK